MKKKDDHWRIANTPAGGKIVYPKAEARTLLTILHFMQFFWLFSSVGEMIWGDGVCWWTKPKAWWCETQKFLATILQIEDWRVRGLFISLFYLHWSWTRSCTRWKCPSQIVLYNINRNNFQTVYYAIMALTTITLDVNSVTCTFSLDFS